MIRPSRALTTLAVGFLALDAVLFAYAAKSTGRAGLLIASIVCAAGAGLVIVAWRRYRRTVADLHEARRELRSEIEAIRALLQNHHLNN